MSQSLARSAAVAPSGLVEFLDAWYARVQMQDSPSDEDRRRAHIAIALLRTQRDGDCFSRPLAQAYDVFERQLRRGPSGQGAAEAARMALLCAIHLARSNFEQ